MKGVCRPAARCIIVNEKDEILLVDDGKTWSLPGGGIDFGENVEDVVRRESLEELGIVGEPEKLICMMDRTRERKGVPTHLIVFIWSIKNNADFENVESSYTTASHAFESEKVQYFGVDDLPQDIAPDGLDGVLKHYIEDRANYYGRYVSGL